MNTIGEPCDRKGHARFDGEALAWDRCYGGAVYAPGGNARKLLARLWLSSSIQCLTLHTTSLAASKYATGNYTDTGIADLLNEAGYRIFPKWRDKNPNRLFTKDIICMTLKEGIWFWAGYVTYKGERIRGQYEAIIPEELLEKCLEVRQRLGGHTGRGRPSKPYRVYLLGKIL